jgi:hypothetical protein
VETKNLAKKMVQVMDSIKYIQKRGLNKFHGYRYATEADVNEKVRDEMAKLNILMIPTLKTHSLRETTTRSGNTEYIMCVDMDFTFIDADSGESIVFSMSGEGQDTGDKAIYKAISGCQKYALMKTFMIPTGDDPENDDGDAPEQPAPKTAIKEDRPKDGDACSQAQIRKIYSLMKTLNISEEAISAVLQKEFSQNAVSDLSKKEASALIDRMMQKNKEGA